MLVCAFLCANCTRDRGCSVHPVFPAPSDFEGKVKSKPRADRAARSQRYVIRRMGRAKRNPSSRAPTLMGIAEFIIGPAEGRTRWLHPSYGLRSERQQPQGVSINGPTARPAKALGE